MPKVVPTVVKKIICKLVQLGKLTEQEIADACDVSRQTVAYYDEIGFTGPALKFGPEKKFSNKQLEKAVEKLMKEQQETGIAKGLEDIADELECCERTVTRRLRECGISYYPPYDCVNLKRSDLSQIKESSIADLTKS